MLTHPAAAARAAVATGVRGKIDTHVSETWKRASLSYIATHPPADLSKKKKKRERQAHDGYMYFLCFIDLPVW